MMNVSFVLLICIHRSIILIFTEKSMLVNFFVTKNFFLPAIFDFYFRENPRFSDEFQALQFDAKETITYLRIMPTKSILFNDTFDISVCPEYSAVYRLLHFFPSLFKTNHITTVIFHQKPKTEKDPLKF